MTLQQLFNTFNKSLRWNAFSYIAYKILSTTLSFFLFYRLSTEHFSIWANIHCTIYLLILWIDCGFRKSIPRYAPEFAHNSHAMRQFINGVILFQALILIASIPIFLFATTRLLNQPDISFIYFGCVMYVFEGISAVLQLVYHAYFWNKQFNLLATSIMFIQMVVNMILLSSIADDKSLVIGIFCSKIAATFTIIFLSSLLLRRLYKQEYDPLNGMFDARVLTRNFIKHSVLMWGSNVIKSLSERNFLVPFFTYSLGAAPANLFKVANDGALFFFRIVYKTIGTTDTALLAHVEASPEKRRYLDLAFKKLIIKVAALCLPLVVIVLAIFVSSSCPNNQFIPYVLATMAVAYLIESLFLPYERILEVKQRYWYLLYSYIPYLTIIMMLISGHIVAYLGLFESIVLIHAVRLGSLCAMVYFARKLYDITFPFRFILIIFACSVAGGVLLYPFITYLINGCDLINKIAPGYCS